jgi:hypothetical protein
MHNTVVAVPTGRVTVSQQSNPSLDDLAACVHDAHAGVISGFFRAIEHATRAANALIAAKALIPHGSWSNFLKGCTVGERQAERYMHLARHVDSNPSRGTDLAGLSIQAAIKQLSPSRPRKAASGGPPTTKTAIAHTNAADIIASWDAAPQNGRGRAINGIGLEALWAVIHSDWMPEIEKLVDCAPAVTASAYVIPDDLSLREFLRRQSPSPVDVTPAGPVTHSSSADVRRAMALDIGEHQ